MFSRLKNFLQTLDTPTTKSKNKTGVDLNDPRVASLALIFSVVDADGQIHEDEITAIETIVARQYQLNPEDSKALIAAGRLAHHESIDIFAFTSTLKRHFSAQQSIDFIGVLWEIAYADNHLYELEDNLIWRIAELLGVSSRDRLNLKKEIAKNSNVTNI